MEKSTEACVLDLSGKECIPCKGGVPPLNAEEQAELLKTLGSDWQIVDGHHLSKTYAFPDFAEALRYTNLVGAMAEEQGHHPDMLVAWGKVRVEVWTHKIDGLVESDFIFAAKAETIFQAMES